MEQEVVGEEGEGFGFSAVAELRVLAVIVELEELAAQEELEVQVDQVALLVVDLYYINVLLSLKLNKNTNRKFKTIKNHL